MNILFVSESQGWSGGASQLLALGLGLAALGESVVLASPADGEVAARARAAGLRHIPFHPRRDYDLAAALRLARLVEVERVDVLHAHHPRAHAVALASRFFSSRRPVFVVTRRVSFEPAANPFSRFKYRSARIDGFVSVAASVRQALLRAGVSPERVRTIPSGVDTDLFAPRPRDEGLARELRLPDGVPVVGKVGNHGAWKGQDVFLRAAALLQRSGQRAVYLLAGRDTDTPELRGLAAELGLEGSVRLAGFRADVPRLLSLLDVSVNAARRGEGISGALRESLAMGIPVVASDAGGNPELVSEGVTGRLCRAGSAEDLAQVLAGVLEDLPGARRLAEAGRRVVAQRFSVAKMVADTLAYYRELRERRGLPRAQAAQSLV